MKYLRYIEGVSTISVDRQKCIGCSMCIRVCPHCVFILDNNKKVKFEDRDGCMECGACAMNCPVEAIQVNPGVGCAALIISRWLKTKNISAGGCC